MPRLASGCRGFPAAPIRNTNFIQLGNPRGTVRWHVSFCAWFWFSRESQGLAVSANSPCEWYPAVPDPQKACAFTQTAVDH